MGITTILGAIKGVWELWDVRCLLLLSLSLQTLLQLLAPLRKRYSNNWLIGGLLCLYLLADWTPSYAAGVITSSDYYATSSSNQPLAFWSTFLLVHSGGSDSITAFALQDNDFWHRHALALVFQCASTAYIFFQTVAENQLWVPTLLMFVCGFIKYYERTRSMYKASLNNLRDSMRKDPDPGPNYARLTAAFRTAREAGLPTSIHVIEVPKPVERVKIGRLGRTDMVLYAHHFFSIFKRLIVDLKCTYYQRVYSLKFFSERSAEDAFGLIELELKFMYDILFTKASVVYSFKGFLLRLVAMGMVITSFCLFHFKEKRFKHSDVAITYILLLGAIFLDVIAFIQLITSRKWLLTAIAKRYDEQWLLPGKSGYYQRLPLRPESVPTYNLIGYCLDLPRPATQKSMDWLGVSGFFEEIWYVKPKRFTDDLRDLIFEEVKNKSEWTESLENIEEVIAARGDWVLRTERGLEALYPYVLGMDYEQTLLSWHIATELCWCSEEKKDRNSNNRPSRDNCKILSDYMMYLVAMQPSLMYRVSDIGQTRLRDTYAEVQKVYPIRKEEEEPRSILPSLRCFFKGNKPAPLSGTHVKVCLDILSTNAEIEPLQIKGDKSKSMLYDGCRLAQELRRLDDRKWDVMSRVWVEMLMYAAVHCRPRALMERLSKGGDLICFVWLLMAHFGLVYQFENFGGLARAKVVVEI